MSNAASLPPALMLGNFITGTSILAPAGMLSELSGGLKVSISDAGLLITFGAIVLCIGLAACGMADQAGSKRHALLTATLAVLALAKRPPRRSRPDYATLLIIRLLMLAVAALYTPQAAGDRRAHCARRETWRHHCLHLSRMVARRGDRAAAGDVHCQPLRLAGRPTAASALPPASVACFWPGVCRVD